MKDLKKKLNHLITKVMTYLPGGELRQCHNISRQNSDCIRHFNHLGRCEDAWRYKWKKEDSL